MWVIGEARVAGGGPASDGGGGSNAEEVEQRRESANGWAANRGVSGEKS